MKISMEPDSGRVRMNLELLGGADESRHVECEHEMLAPHPHYGDGWLRCKYCTYKVEMEYE